MSISRSVARDKDNLTDRTIRPHGHSHNNCIVHRQSRKASPVTSYGMEICGWLANALDCESRGQGSSSGRDRFKDSFFFPVLSEPTLVQTRKCPSRLRLHSRPTKVAAHVKDPMSTFLQRLVAYIDTYRQRIKVTD